MTKKVLRIQKERGVRGRGLLRRKEEEGAAAAAGKQHEKISCPCAYRIMFNLTPSFIFHQSIVRQQRRLPHL